VSRRSCGRPCFRSVSIFMPVVPVTMLAVIMAAKEIQPDMV
jgi:hypothetical protein